MKRYSFAKDYDEIGQLYESESGEYVEFSEVERLEKRVGELEKLAREYIDECLKPYPGCWRNEHCKCLECRLIDLLDGGMGENKTSLK